MLKRAALDSGEYSLVDLELVLSRLIPKDKSSSGSSESLILFIIV